MKIVFTPDWFLGKDVLIDVFSFLVLFAFFILCVRYYKLNKKRNFLSLGTGFLLIALAQLATILTKFVLYYDTSFIQTIGQMVITYKIVNTVNIFYHVGFFFQRFLTLIGLYVIYKIPSHKKVKDLFPMDYLLILLALVGLAVLSIIAYWVFHLAVILFLALITSNYLKVYKENKSRNTRILIIAFALLALAHLIYFMSPFSILYVLANLIELVSYLILLFLIIRLLRCNNALCRA